ncbi:PRK06851 family protein [Aquibacillus sediminis]|uniref:PRK06851 family protein n=1 Tax=Aquibacillus sediminis TaxID=2574734 RepID=UPI00110933F5|nr:PRK06851 family protein [Aquibacillus sediminis]
MSGKAINYYAGGNTAKGFYDLLASNLQGLESVYIVNGGLGTETSTLMKKLAQTWQEKGYTIELIHSSSDNDSLDGVIIPKLKFAIVDGTAPYTIKPKAPGAVEHYVNLGTAWDTAVLAEHRDDIIEYQQQIDELFTTAHQSFKTGLEIHDYLEEIYIKEMDFEKANKLTNLLIDTIFIGEQSATGSAKTHHRFFGASTPEGVVDFIPNITEGLAKRYFIKGRAGTGKSTVLKKLANAAKERNFDIELYHCGFDPDSMDMLIVRELGVCIFDSTDPHEYFPNRHGDEIVDLYEQTVTPGTDEKYEQEIAEFTNRYKQRMKDGVAYLQEAKVYHDKVAEIYHDAMDEAVVDEIYEQLNEELLKLENR